jgi:two-component system nitrate/nitrite response regulator NarP
MSDQSTIQVLSIESGAEGKQALRELLTKIPGLVVAADATNAADALQKLQSHQIDIAVLDLGSHDMDGIGLIKQIRQANPPVRVLIVTASDAPDDIFASMDAGADAYVLKGTVATALEPAIRSARLGAVWLDPGIANQVLLAMETPTSAPPSRILPTGYLRMPVMPDEKDLLMAVAASSCTDGVCMVDPSFVKKLKRFSPAAT